MSRNESVKHTQVSIRFAGMETIKIGEELKFTLATYEYRAKDNKLEIGLTSCFGSKEGRFVGEKLATLPFVVLCGDANYERNYADYEEKDDIREKFFDKFPGDGYKTFNPGNHDGGIHGSHSGSGKRVQFIANYFKKTPGNLWSTLEVDERGVAFPRVECFLDLNENIKRFYLVHLYSTLLPWEPYKEIVVALFKHIKRQHPECNIYITSHHAPATVGVRRHDKKDALRYLEHMKILDECILSDTNLRIIKMCLEKEYKIFEEAHEQWNKNYKQWQTNPGTSKDVPEMPGYSPYCWNYIVAQSLLDVYIRLAKDGVIFDQQFKLLGTFSGHDHYSGVMRPDHPTESKSTDEPDSHPLAFLDGTGSQEGIRLVNAKKQHAVSKYVKVGNVHQRVFGIDCDNEQNDAIYLRAGYMTIVVDNHPKLNRYYLESHELRSGLASKLGMTVNFGEENENCITIKFYYGTKGNVELPIYSSKHLAKYHSPQRGNLQAMIKVDAHIDSSGVKKINLLNVNSESPEKKSSKEKVPVTLSPRSFGMTSLNLKTARPRSGTVESITQQTSTSELEATTLSEESFGGNSINLSTQRSRRGGENNITSQEQKSSDFSKETDSSQSQSPLSNSPGFFKESSHRPTSNNSSLSPAQQIPARSSVRMGGSVLPRASTSAPSTISISSPATSQAQSQAVAGHVMSGGAFIFHCASNIAKQLRVDAATNSESDSQESPTSGK